MSCRRLAITCALVACAAALALALGATGPASADIASRVDSKATRAEKLRAAIAAESRRISQSASGLARAQRRLRGLQAQAAQQRAELERVQAQLRRSRARLTRLIKLQRDATDALSANLQTAYRTPKPDIVSVIVSADGFADLLEKADFFKRVAERNARIMDIARRSRTKVAGQAARLNGMQRREQALASKLDRRRDSAQVVEAALLREREQRVSRKATKRAELRTIQDELAKLRKRLARTARNGIATKAGGPVEAPPGAPPAVALVIAAANAIAGTPYLYGGGHAGFKDTAYDCSGSVSYALAAAGLVQSPMASGGFMTWGEAGPGKWITTYANGGHMFMVIAGWRFDTSALGGGTRWTRAMRSTAGLVARHPPGL